MYQHLILKWEESMNAHDCNEFKGLSRVFEAGPNGGKTEGD